MANTNQKNDDDFGFNEQDLQGSNSEGMRAESVLAHDEFDEPRSNEELDNLHEPVDDVDVAAPTNAPPKESFASKFGLYIAVGFGVLVLVCGLGWVAVKILAPAPANTTRVSSAETFGTPETRAKKQDVVPAIEPMQLASDNESAAVISDTEGRNEVSVDTAGKNNTPGSVLAITPRTEQEQDEEFYDTLVSAAEHNAPAQPVSKLAAPVQVEPEMADKFAAISVAIAHNSKEMSTVLDAIAAVSAEVKTLKSQVEASSIKTTLFEGKLTQLNASMSDLSKNTEARFNDISKAAVAAAIQAVMKESSAKTSSSGKMVLVGGALKPDYPSEKSSNKRAEPKTPPKPLVAVIEKPVSAPAKPKVQQESVSQANACGARTVSQVWKVKGVTSGGAYVRRDDGSALMLRVDMDVPGFGRVKSFDPNSRTVCTTSGLIAR